LSFGRSSPFKILIQYFKGIGTWNRTDVWSLVKVHHFRIGLAEGRPFRYAFSVRIAVFGKICPNKLTWHRISPDLRVYADCCPSSDSIDLDVGTHRQSHCRVARLVHNGVSLPDSQGVGQNSSKRPLICRFSIANGPAPCVPAECGIPIQIAGCFGDGCCSGRIDFNQIIGKLFITVFTAL